MRLRLHSLLAIALAGALVACSSEKPNYDNMSELELYTRAQQEIKVGNMKSGTAILEAMDKNYPFGPYSQQMQLNLIYAYYKSDNLTLALATVDRFLKLNPTHPNVDWVVYMRGLINMRLDYNMIQSFFGIDRSDRDRAFVMAAFKDFTYLVTRHPSSPYVVDANKRLIYIKNRLATYQLKVAQYYTDRGAYVAVINRVTRMLSEFPDTQATKQGLELMLNAYNKLGLTKEAAKTDLLIQANIKNTPKNSDNPVEIVQEKPKEQKKEVQDASLVAKNTISDKKEIADTQKETKTDQKTVSTVPEVVTKKEANPAQKNNSVTEKEVALTKEATTVATAATTPKNDSIDDKKEISKNLISQKALNSKNSSKQENYPIIVADMRRIQENTIKDMENALYDSTEFAR